VVKTDIFSFLSNLDNIFYHVVVPQMKQHRANEPGLSSWQLPLWMSFAVYSWSAQHFMTRQN